MRDLSGSTYPCYGSFCVHPDIFSSRENRKILRKDTWCNICNHGVKYVAHMRWLEVAVPAKMRTCIRLQSPGKASPGTGELMSQSFPGEKVGRGSIKNGNLYI